MATGTFRGDFKKLDQWVKRLDKVGSGSWRPQLTERMAQASLGLVRRGFAREAEPSGKKWKRRSRKQFAKGKVSAYERAARAQAGDHAARPNHPILDKTGALKKSWRVAFADARGFKIASDNKVAGYHQRGVQGGKIIRPRTAKALAFPSGNRIAVFSKVKQGKIVARPMVPRTSRSLPREWKSMYVKIASRVFRRAIGISSR